MYLVRALNNLDILGDPLENGIASKQMIYRIVKNYYEKSNNLEYLSLNDEEKDLFIKEHMEEYLRDHNKRIKNKYFKSSNKAREDTKEFVEFVRAIKSKSREEQEALIRDNKEGLNFGSYIQFLNYISSLQRHLMFGSSKITDWISFSTKFDSVFRYYQYQDIHKVAVVRSDSGGLVDSDNILTIDLSTMDRIKDKPYLCNQIDVRFEKVMDLIEDLCRIDPSLTMKFKRCAINETDKNARGFKYANNSNEVCVFKYVPKDHIVAVLEALQIDLIRTNAFSTEFLKLSKEDQKKELDILKKSIEYSLINYHDPFLMHVFYELYINNKSINRIVTVQDSEEKIKRARNKVLEIARHTPNIQIKR